eukprot:jgi/Ulvmu1/6575/UM003_0212.1
MAGSVQCDAFRCDTCMPEESPATKLTLNEAQQPRPRADSAPATTHCSRAAEMFFISVLRYVPAGSLVDPDLSACVDILRGQTTRARQHHRIQNTAAAKGCNWFDP